MNGWTRSVAMVSTAIVVLGAAACSSSTAATTTVTRTPGACGTRPLATNASLGGGVRYSEYCTSAQPDSITAGPDGAIWFMERTGLNYPIETVGRVTATGVTNEYTIPGGPWYGGFINPYGSSITAGPDGALWFTGSSKNGTIGRVSVSGSTTAYHAEPPNSLYDTLAITAGPDGALWYTATDEIGRMSTAGIPTRFTCVPCLGHDALSIAVGPDNALWFTSYGEILRILTSGSIDSPIVPRVTAARSITRGPDGAMWFTQSADAIGRITASGAVTNFPVPPEPNAGRGTLEPTAITAGPDGALWFTEPAGKIVRITTSGVLTQYAVSATPTNITSGPDHALWFVEAGNRIGRFALG
jgi:virginiamycin B lyase